MELKPCPFCGGEVTHEIDSWGSMSWIECRVCGRMLATRCDGLPDDPPSPSMAFNRRPIEDTLATRVAELEAENKRLRKALTTLTDFVQTRVLDSGPDCDCDAAGHICGWPAWQREVRFARAALEVQP